MQGRKGDVMNIYFIHDKLKDDEYEDDLYSVIAAPSEEAVRKLRKKATDLRIKQIGVTLEGIEEGEILTLYPE
jgi:hypothetical protein